MDENNIHNSPSLRPSRLKELDKTMHLGLVIEMLHPLDTIPHPVLVLFIEIKRILFESGVGFSYVERLLRGPASKIIGVARSVVYDMVDLGFVLQQKIYFATCWHDLVNDVPGLSCHGVHCQSCRRVYSPHH
jgi:hypothetical protein